MVFNQYGASSLDILLYCFLEVEDWSEELIQRQNLFLEIMRLAKHMGVDFAYPTQSLHIENFPEKEGLKRHQTSWSDSELMAIAGDFAKDGSMARPAGLAFLRRKAKVPQRLREAKHRGTSSQKNCPTLNFEIMVIGSQSNPLVTDL